MAKKIDPKAKAKKQKIYAAVGGVLLLGLLAFQVPRTLKMMHPADPGASSSPPASTTSTPATPSPVAAPSLSGGNAAPAPTGRDGLADSDPVSAPQSGQLLAFGLFRTKDPFVQQINLNAGTNSGAPPSTSTTGPTGVNPTTPTSGAPSTGAGSKVVAVTPTSTSRTSAEISVNGVTETVAIGGRFPSSDPFFKLVSLTAKGAKISIAGGALANGSATVTLTKAKPLTLQNTADGTRYVLRLLSVS